MWKHARGTRQYDVLCLLIIAFIFLTPKSWFSDGENLATQPSRLVVKASDFSSDTGEMQKLVKEVTGNQFAEVTAWREQQNERGETIYIIEFR